MLIIGFCDVHDKSRGMDDVTLFRAEDRFESPRVPTTEEMLGHARERGYHPSGRRGAIDGRCDPVYLLD